MFMIVGEGCPVCKRMEKILKDEGLNVHCENIDDMDIEEVETVMRSGIKSLPILCTKDGMIGVHDMGKTKFLELVNANI